MMKYKNLKIGIVGSGYWATNIIKTLEDLTNTLNTNIDHLKDTIINLQNFTLEINRVCDSCTAATWSVPALLSLPSLLNRRFSNVLHKASNLSPPMLRTTLGLAALGELNHPGTVGSVED